MLVLFGLTFYFSTFCLSEAINIISDNYMQRSYGDCGKTINGVTNAYIRSHVGAYQLGTLLKYDSGENCSITYSAGIGKQVLLKFIEFDLQQEVNDTCLDRLSVYDLDPTDPDITACGTNVPAFESSGDSVTLKFITDNEIQKKGFKILASTYRIGECSAEEFRCDSDRCIPRSHVCDTIDHCIDGADEDESKAKCTLLDKVIGTVFRLGEHTLLAIAILISAIVFILIASIVVYKIWCRKKTNRVGVEESNENLPTGSNSTKKSSNQVPGAPKKAWKKEKK